MPVQKALLQQRYVVLEQAGRGGMGAVYRAYDQRLRTHVALKQTFFTGESDLARFEREAQLLARLRHRGLPKVSDYFVEGDGQYLVMDYITGPGLDELRQHSSGLFDATNMVRIVDWTDQLLDILEYLHTRRSPIVHRDIKPKNLKLSERDEIVLLDFGLARGGFSQDGENDGATKPPDTGLMIHTPPYAPLEQVRGEEPDSRNDLYAVGATLYYLFAGRPPEDPMSRAMALSVQSDPLRPLVDVVPKILPMLSELIQWMMMLFKDDRPKSAREVRDELQLIRRSLVDVSSRFPLRSPRRNGDTTITRPATLAAASPVGRAQQGEAPLRTVNTGSNIRAVAFDAPGGLIAAGYEDHTIGVWTLHDMQQTKLLVGHTGAVRSVSFSPDRRQVIASSSEDDSVRLWNMAGQSYELNRRRASVSSAVFSPDGTSLAMCGWNSGTALWHWQNDRLAETWRVSNGLINDVVFSQDSQFLAEGRYDGSVVIWNIQTRKQHVVLSYSPVPVFSVAFSPDGKFIAAGGNNHNVYLWRVSDGRQLDIFQGHTGAVRGIAWSPDSELLVSVSEDRTARIWSTNEGTTRYPPLQHQAGVACVAWSPDGGILVTGCHDMKLRLWRVPV